MGTREDIISADDGAEQKGERMRKKDEEKKVITQERGK